MDIQVSTPKRWDLPQYEAPRSNVIRTKHPSRPEWLDQIKRPLRIIALDQRQFDMFIRRWLLQPTECRRILEIKDVEGVSTAFPVLVLDNAADYQVFSCTSPLLIWKQRGGEIIGIPEAAIKMTGLGFSEEDNLIASTIVQLATQRHLDSLNGK